LQVCFDTSEVWSRRISTSKINRWLEAALNANAPPASSGRRIKIKYMTQVKSRPPHFALFGNQLDNLPQSYVRYLVNHMREDFDLPGVPIRLSLRTSENPFEKDGKR
jgi:GTPase